MVTDGWNVLRSPYVKVEMLNLEICDFFAYFRLSVDYVDGVFL